MILSKALFLKRDNVGIAAIAAGLAVCWLTQTPFAMVAPIGLAFFQDRTSTVQILNASLAVAVTISMFVIESHGSGRPAIWGALLSLTFLAVAAFYAANAKSGRVRKGTGRRPQRRQPIDASAGFLGLMHPDDRATAEQAAARAFWTGVPQVMRFRLRQQDGNYVWSEVRTDPTYGVRGNVDVLSTDEEQPMCIDGERLDAAGLGPVRAAHVVEELFGNGWAFDAEGRWIYLPLFAQATLGKTPDELNRSLDDGYIAWKQLLHPDEYDAVAEKWSHSIRTGEPFNAEHRIRRKSGFAWARSAARSVRNKGGLIVGWYGTSIDIDVQRKTLSDLKAREQSLTQLIDMVPGRLWMLAPDGQPIFHNKRLTDYLGFAIPDVRTEGTASLELNVEQVIHPDDIESVTATLQRSLATGVSFSSRYRVRRSDGVYRWMEGRAEPFRDQDGRILQWYGISHDIDGQINAEDALSRSERHLHGLLDALPIQVCSWLPSGEMTYINKRYSDALGFADANFSDFLATARALIHPDDVEKVSRTAAHCLSTGQTFAFRYRRRSSDGSFRWLDSRFEPLRDESGTISEWYGLVIDVDDEVQVQEKLRAAQVELARASQATTLAELSASIAHEVAQPLAALVSSSDACQRWLTSEPPNVERALGTLERVIQSADSAVDVVTRIRALFKQGVDARTVSDLGSVISKTCDLLADEATGHHVRWDVVIDEGLPALTFDKVQIQQVLVNLMRNAIEAMDSTSDRRILTVRARHLDGAVRVEIGDTGRGIECPERIFEAFFTTKAEGMGMGLAICRSIIESHGGRLWAEAVEPHGAKFTFTLMTDTAIRP
ncbi:PAS domain S-box-containing protein [Rhizobium sp. BK181]|uniref:PAS domain-containing protein n=1 Tax=Rhizobium sp. BK181 TaxID=2587072 RepID=UPI0016086078|nr:PAS domain-containing protein [Rhizobium sp. BK181]MBB3318873.1 PAS domain S-box-containing protein [Rhizobium sp. BK181]